MPHQSSLLLEEEALVSKMESISSTTAELLGKRKCKPGILKKNADRIHQHTIALEDVNTQLQASPSGTSHDKAKRRKVLLDRQKYHLCELKKAQDAMRKNLNASMATVKAANKAGH